MANNTTKTKQLDKALKGLQQYIKDPNADLAVVSAYLKSLADWVDAPVEADSSNPPPPPPPPPGH